MEHATVQHSMPRSMSAKFLRKEKKRRKKNTNKEIHTCSRGNGDEESFRDRSFMCASPTFVTTTLEGSTWFSRHDREYANRNFDDIDKTNFKFHTLADQG